MGLGPASSVWGGTAVQSVLHRYPSGDQSSLTLVHSNGWTSTHRAATGQLLSTVSPSRLDSEAGLPAGPLVVSVPCNSVSVCSHGSGGWLWVPQTRGIALQPQPVEERVQRPRTTYHRGTTGAVVRVTEDQYTAQVLLAVDVTGVTSSDHSTPSRTAVLSNVHSRCLSGLTGTVSCTATLPGSAGARNPAFLLLGLSLLSTEL